MTRLTKQTAGTPDQRLTQISTRYACARVLACTWLALVSAALANHAAREITRM